MDILENLWQGNIDPIGKPLCVDGPYHNVLRRSAATEAKLRKTLNPEQKHLLEAITDAAIEMQSIAQTEAFMDGFRLATQLLWSGLKKA